MSPSDQFVSSLEIEREVAIDYVLERLEEIRDIVQGALDSIDPPHQPMRMWGEPHGGLSALEQIGDAAWKAEAVWRQ